MEILNNIWNALSTENAQVISLISYPCIFIESFLVPLLFVNLLNIKCNNKQNLIYVILVSFGRYYKQLTNPYSI